MHHTPRPISMKTDLPRKRQRYDAISPQGLPNEFLNQGLNLIYGNAYYPMNFNNQIPINPQFLYNQLNASIVASPTLDSGINNKLKKKQRYDYPFVKDFGENKSTNSSNEKLNSTSQEKISKSKTKEKEKKKENQQNKMVSSSSSKEIEKVNNNSMTTTTSTKTNTNTNPINNNTKDMTTQLNTKSNS